LAAPWIEATDLGAIPDDPRALAEALTGAAATADLVVTTGGVSVGDEDHMPRMFREAGGEAHAMSVAMKPGKPLAIGRLGEAIWIGLPGNPVSAFIAWTAFGARIAAARAGIADHAPRSQLAQADFDLERRPGRCEFRPARITGTGPGGAPKVQLLSPSFSARIALLAAADGLALLPAEEERIRRGDLLTLLPF
jgi:molybdopterin molybdotransferase